MWSWGSMRFHTDLERIIFHSTLKDSEHPELQNWGRRPTPKTRHHLTSITTQPNYHQPSVLFHIEIPNIHISPYEGFVPNLFIISWYPGLDFLCCFREGMRPPPRRPPRGRLPMGASAPSGLPSSPFALLPSKRIALLLRCAARATE